MREVRENQDFLDPLDLRELLTAALAMDFARGPGWPRRRTKNPPIAPFTLIMLLGGFRGGEATITARQIVCARRVLVSRFSAPPFKWATLRHTCGTFLACAPAIYGGASAFPTAKRLDHTARTAEKHYYGARTGIRHEARTLEAAMGIEDLAEEIIRRATDRSAP